MANMQSEIGVCVRNLSRQRRRSLMAMAAVSFGIAALMLAGGFIQWIFSDLRESTIHSQLGHIQVTRPGFQSEGRANPFAFLLPPGGPEFDRISREPGVVAIAPRIYFSGLISHGDTTVSCDAEGVNPASETQLSRSISIVKGQSLQPGDAKGVVFGLGLARNLGVSVGDHVVLLVNKPSGGINATELVVRGLFSTVTKAYDDVALRLPIGTAQHLLGVAGAHAWVVLLDHTDATRATTRALRQILPSSKFEVVPWYDLADFYKKTVSLFSKQVGFVKLIIAVIIALSITNTMMMGVMERTGEIGTAMALGANRRQILRLFLYEGALLGTLGGLVGIVVGGLLAILLSFIGIPMPPPPGMAHGFIGKILITPGLAGGAFVLAITTTLVASVYPAWKASRMVIVDALRHNR